MARARSSENSVHEGDTRGAAPAAPRSTSPPKLVEAAVAGDDLQSVARAAAAALGSTVVIALPDFGLSAQWPLSAGESGADTLATQAHRLGYDFTHGALAIGVALDDRDGALDLDAAKAIALLVEVDEQRLLGLVPLAGGADHSSGGDNGNPGDGGDGGESSAAALLSHLRAAGLQAVASAPRPGPDGLQAALQEAGVLLELLIDDASLLSAHEETFRLLIGVLIHNPDELAALRSSTIAPLESYDAAHDTELLTTLETFLAHHGSTTDTAESMRLHRHTVGYRLARVQEVSGLSPYESEGRERLSLGLKAKRVLLAEGRRAAHVRAG